MQISYKLTMNAKRVNCKMYEKIFLNTKNWVNCVKDDKIYSANSNNL